MKDAEGTEDEDKRNYVYWRKRRKYERTIDRVGNDEEMKNKMKRSRKKMEVKEKMREESTEEKTERSKK